MSGSRAPWRRLHGRWSRIASTGRRLVAVAGHRHATVRFGDDCYVGPGFRLTLGPGATFEVGDHVELRRGFTCEIGPGGRVSISDGCRFTYDTVIQCSTSVDIGRDCLIGRVMIADGNHRFREPHLPLDEQGFDLRPLTIGPGAVVHTHAVITASLGERAVVGANSVVTRDVPPFSLAAGTPARVVERFAPGSPEDPPGR